VDDLSEKTRVLPIPLCKTTDDEEENRNTRDFLVEVLYRKTGENPLEHPLKTYYIEKAIEVYQKLPAEVRKKTPFCQLYRIFKPWDDWHFFFIQYCADKTLAEQLARMRMLHESTRLSTYAASERLMESVLAELAVRWREGNRWFNVEKLIEQKWVIIIRGGTREAFRMVAANWSKAIISHFEMGGRGRARIVYEEYEADGTTGEPEIRALKTLRKSGLSQTYISQDFPEDERQRKAIVQNVGVHVIHRCASWETAEPAARLLSGLLDPDKVHHYTERQLHDGYSFEKVQNVSHQTRRTTNDPLGIKRVEDVTSYAGSGTNITESERALAEYRTVMEAQYQALSDQHVLRAAEIQNELKRGERYINAYGRIYRDYVPLPRPRWPWPGVLEEKIEQWLEEMRQLPCYITPDFSEPRLPCEVSRPSGNGKRSSSSGRTHQHTTTSKKSGNTARTKRHNGQQSGGRRKGTSNT